MPSPSASVRATLNRPTGSQPSRYRARAQPAGRSPTRPRPSRGSRPPPAASPSARDGLGAGGRRRGGERLRRGRAARLDEGRRHDAEGVGVPRRAAVKKARFAAPRNGARAAYKTTIVSQADNGRSAATRSSSTRRPARCSTGKTSSSQSRTTRPGTLPIAPPPRRATRARGTTRTPTPASSGAGRRGRIAPFAAQDTARLSARCRLEDAWDVNPDPVTGDDLGTTQSTGNNADDDPALGAGGQRRVGDGYHATSADPRLPLPVHERVVQRELRPGGPGRDRQRHRRRDHEPVRMHNRMHDFAYYLGFDEPHWNAQQYNNGLRRRRQRRRSTATRRRLRSAAAHRTTTAATTRT